MTKEIVCREAGYDCEFEVRSENGDELVDFAREHAERTHGTVLDRSDVAALVRDA